MVDHLTNLQGLHGHAGVLELVQDGPVNVVQNTVNGASASCGIAMGVVKQANENSLVFNDECGCSPYLVRPHVLRVLLANYLQGTARLDIGECLGGIAACRFNDL